MDKLTQDQFAEKIKAKYPAYAAVDNATLTQKMLQKYPEYADRVAVAQPTAQQAIQPTSPEAPTFTEPNLLQKGIGLFANPIMESATRAGQAVGVVGAKAVNAITGGLLDKYTPEGDLNAAIERSLNTPVQLPVTGKVLKGAGQETGKEVGGRALGTVALAIPSVVGSGAAIGAANALENNKSLGGVAVESALTAVGGKILQFGLSKATPYIIEALTKFGTPFLEKLQAQLPAYMKPALDEVISAGNKYLRESGAKTFDAATSGITKEALPIDTSKVSEAAWKDMRPILDKTTKEAYAKQGNVTERGLFGKAEITPSKNDIPVTETYGKLYENGTITEKMTPKEKLLKVNEVAAQKNSEQKAFLAQNDIAVPVTNRFGEGIVDKLVARAKQATIPFKGDKAATSAYESAVTIFKNYLKTGTQAGATKGSTTLTKISDALTAFDKQMEKFGAWEKNMTGALNDTDRARILAIRDIHEEARNFIQNSLPKNSPWAAIRLEESHLYDAAGRLSEKLAQTVGKSKFTQFLKDNKGILKTVGYITGFGGSAALGASFGN